LIFHGAECWAAALEGISLLPIVRPQTLTLKPAPNRGEELGLPCALREKGLGDTLSTVEGDEGKQSN
jgi:hypothetical protein